MTSGKRGREEKNLGSKRTKNGRSSKEARLESTRGAWVSRKQKRKSGTQRASTTILVGQMPKDTIDEWLKKQPVVEREERKEVTPPLGTTEEWLRRQVSERLSKKDEK